MNIGVAGQHGACPSLRGVIREQLRLILAKVFHSIPLAPCRLLDLSPMVLEVSQGNRLNRQAAGYRGHRTRPVIQDHIAYNAASTFSPHNPFFVDAQDVRVSMPDDSSKAEELNQQLLASYNELAELAGSLAHEIKNPLSVIRMNMDLLAEDLAQPETQRERRAVGKVNLVQQQCVRLENLLNDFLRFARLRNLDLHAGNLNEQVERVLDLFDPQANELGVEVIRLLDADLASILLEPQTMQAALVNLVKNSLEAMPEGGTLTVRTRLTRFGVALDLIDTGCGMDEKTAMNMFDAFYSTKNGGSGLGLPTARKIIEAHGGRIDVQSALNRGTKFTLEFPTPKRIG